MGIGPQARQEGVQAQDGSVTSHGVTFDTAVLIALERRRQRAWEVYRRAQERKTPITVPLPLSACWEGSVR